MRILYAGQSLAEPRGGGELSARALVWAISRSHDIRVVGAASRTEQRSLAPGCEIFDYAMPPTLGLPRQPGLTATERSFRGVVADHIERFAPEVVMLQQPSWLAPSDLPATATLVLFIRSALCFAAWDPNPSLWRRAVAWPFAAARFRSYRPLLDRADLIVTNSGYMRDELWRRRGVRSVAVPPLIMNGSAEQYLPASNADARIAFVGLGPWKGGDLSIRIAAASPRRRFLFLAGNRASAALRLAAERLENVEVLDWTSDIHAAFRRTRLLLMPSRWAEPFGRVAVEAASHGVPTIATAIGGIPEAVGDGGVLIPPASGLSRWRDAIELLDDPRRFEQCATAALAHARQFDFDKILGRLQTALHEHGGVHLPLVPGSASEFAMWSRNLEAGLANSARANGSLS